MNSNDVNASSPKPSKIGGRNMSKYNDLKVIISANTHNWI